MSIKSKVILIVDDDPEIIKLLSKIFEVLGVVIYSANTLAGAKKVVHKVIPHLVFLDIKLGQENGLDFITYLKTFPFGASIPTLVFSATDDKKVQKLALNHGAADYVTKPIVASQLIQKVRKLIKDTATSNHVFFDYIESPQMFKIEASISKINQSFIEVESSVKINDSSIITINSPLCDKINFTNGKFISADNVKIIDFGRFQNKLYFFGASDVVLQNILQLRFK